MRNARFYAEWAADHAIAFGCSFTEALACLALKNKHADACIDLEGYYHPGMEKLCLHEKNQRSVCPSWMRGRFAMRNASLGRFAMRNARFYAEWAADHAIAFGCSFTEALACLALKNKHADACIDLEGYYHPGMEKLCLHEKTK